ncbi:MAG TPA: TatD family hydrolase, partial [Burkholderiaceae bacterium]|nr:TatD family hydrolase [Burkholderiaceae bacterium]
DARVRALERGVGLIVVPAVAVGNFSAVRQLARQQAGARCVYALGIHPMCVDSSADGDLEVLRSALRSCADDPDLVAIGEIGLDFFVPGLDRVRQEKFFVAQLEMAREFDLPVIVHVRRSQDIVLKHLRRLRPSGGIAHAFNGSHQQAGIFVDLGLALGFGGAMTFTRALQIRRLATDLGPEVHVLETDSPDISPAWLHPQRNEPAELARIAEVLAELRGESVEACIEQTCRNACRVLPRLKAALPAG